MQRIKSSENKNEIKQLENLPYPGFYKAWNTCFLLNYEIFKENVVEGVKITPNENFGESTQKKYSTRIHVILEPPRWSTPVPELHQTIHQFIN